MPSLIFGSQDDLTNGYGAMVTAGFQIADEPCAMVFPMINTGGTNPGTALCDAAVQAILEWVNMASGLLTVLSNKCYLAYLEAVGMTDGVIPARWEFAPDDYPGGVNADAVPQQVAALCTMYQDPSGTFGDHLKRAHQYIPGLPLSAWKADTLDGAVQSVISASFNTLIFTGVTESTYNTTWKRYLAQPYEIVDGHKTRPSGLNVPTVAAFGVRRYPATQRRRLLPRY